mmetsp:Transcript_13160/g.30251  ORF Transcript_13160/g.30251 Transcript_13160/m.30251 type:complete len:387 (+) Transcript_13160:109-1269(+)
MKLRSCIVLAIFSDTSAFARNRDRDTVSKRLTHKIDRSLNWRGREFAGRKAETQLEMSSQGLVYGTAVATTFGMQSLGFVLAYLLKTETFYDVFGGFNYLVLALLSSVLGASGGGSLSWVDDPRKILTTVLFGLSRGWLLLFLAWRAHERKGDSRFDEVLGKGEFAGQTPQPLRFFVFWIAQAFWVMLVSLPMLFVNASSVIKPNFSPYDVTMAVLFGIGVIVEIIGDIQKAWWVRRGREGDFCSVGLWKYSRHPNYFGEIFQWWCLWLFSYSSSTRGYADPLWWLGILSPLFTMQILMTMEPTGLCNAEGKNLKRYYDKCPERYQKYRDNTSILWPFVGYGYVPMFLKRTFFLDFEKYEYKDAATTNNNKDELEGIADYGSSGNQ